MNTIEARDLNNDELAAVAGGMDCATAVAIGWIYTTTALALYGLGDKVGAAFFLGKSEGVVQGGCPK